METTGLDGYNKRMIAVLESAGIPTGNVLSEPGMEAGPGGVILELRIFLSFGDMTDELCEALAAVGVRDLRGERS